MLGTIMELAEVPGGCKCVNPSPLKALLGSVLPEAFYAWRGLSSSNARKAPYLASAKKVQMPTGTACRIGNFLKCSCAKGMHLAVRSSIPGERLGMYTGHKRGNG